MSREEVYVDFMFKLALKLRSAAILFSKHIIAELMLSSEQSPPPDRMIAVMAIVEDEQGNALILNVYNHEEQALIETLQGVRTIIVKEPYLRLLSDGEFGLRVDHLSDIIYLPKCDPRVPPAWKPEVFNKLTSLEWKEIGNDLFNLGRCYNAIECYTQGLSVLPTEDQSRALKLNLALASLKTQQYELAIQHLDSLPREVMNTEKALFRKSQALYGLQRYKECCEVLKQLLREYPACLPARNEFIRAIKRLAEQRHARYSFKKLYQEAERLFPPNLDHATYMGPVAIRPAGSRRRGLFTTAAVRAGDLLFCEKAFVHSYMDADNPEHFHQMILVVNSATDLISMGARAKLLPLVAQKLHRNPSQASTFTNLYHGNYNPVNVTEVDGRPVVDTFLAERIIAMNVFGSPSPSRKWHLNLMSRTGRLQNAQNDVFHSCGIWPTASYINHSRDSNAYRAFIGDMMIARATKDLPANTEITFCYRSVSDEDYDENKNIFETWGFECNCVVCNDMQTTDKRVLARRNALWAVVKRLLKSNRGLNTTRIETTLETIAGTYSRPATEVPQLKVADGQLILATIYKHRSEPVKVIDFALRTLESLGYLFEGGSDLARSGKSLTIQRWGSMDDSLVTCWVFLAEAYRDVAQGLVASATRYAKISYQICIGEGETFEETYLREWLV
ncbi:TPR domain protein [Aspergillus ellipticus CBS 707.79]|uniref:TPR domain protein n=1 Tax=Aspergillus ellipticus CBS 707.79 TaxID=1448320 RepID=A0A319D664_9EURO|nr:TPR domain protein [Aspergillus ellipticus CBS 707.79]